VGGVGGLAGRDGGVGVRFAQAFSCFFSCFRW